MKILVTGASGFLGISVATNLLNKGHEVVAVDLHLPEVQNQIDVITGDLRDLNFCDSIMEGINVVIHLGAIPSPTDKRQYKVFANNVDSSFAVFSAAAEAKVEKVIYSSSVAIYGFSYSEKKIIPNYFPIDELHPIHYQDSYAFSKHVNELSAKMWFERTGLSFVGIRFPYLSNEKNLLNLIQENSKKSPEIFQKMFWSYLDLRDAVIGLEIVALSRFKGEEVFNLVAPYTFFTESTSVLIKKFFPECQTVSQFIENQSPFSSKKFISKFGYQPKYLLNKSKLVAAVE